MHMRHERFLKSSNLIGSIRNDGQRQKRQEKASRKSVKKKRQEKAGPSELGMTSMILSGSYPPCDFSWTSICFLNSSISSCV